MSEENLRKRELEHRLVDRLISNVHNGETLQIRADRFIDRVIHSYSRIKLTPDEHEHVLDGTEPITLNEFIFGLRLLHPIEQFSNDISSPPDHACVNECFLRMIGIIRSRRPRKSELTAIEFLTTFIDPDRIVAMTTVCPGRTLTNESLGSTTFEMYRPFPDEIQSSYRVHKNSENIGKLLNEEDERVSLDETQIHFLRSEDQMYAQTSKPFKMVVTRESLLVSSLYLLSIYRHDDITSDEAERIIFDAFRIFRRDLIISDIELHRTIEFYRSFSDNEYTTLSPREKITFNLTLDIVRVVSGLIHVDRSVFTP